MRIANRLINYMNQRKFYIGIYFLFLSNLFVYTSCGQKVTITKDYVYSSSWQKGEYQGFRIMKIKLNDSTISVFDKKF